MLAATHILRGKLLYREVWDHKPPLVHLVNAAALATGDGTVNAVRTIERTLAALLAAVGFWILRSTFRSVSVAILGVFFLLVHFYDPSVFRGNQPEEYGTFLSLLGILGLVTGVRSSGRTSTALISAGGFGFGLASLAKETFALGAVPFLLWLVALSWPDRRRAIQRALAFVAAAAIPWVIFYSWILAQKLLPEWRAVLSFNLSYLRFDDNGIQNPGLFARLSLGAQRGWELVLSRSWAALVLGTLGAASVADRRFQRSACWFPAVVLGYFLACLLAASQARRYDYYFLQLVGGYAFLSASGIAFVAHRAGVVWRWRTMNRFKWGCPEAGQRCGRSWWSHATAVIVTTAALLLADWSVVDNFARGVAQPRRRFGDGDRRVAFIEANTSVNDTVWNLVRDGAWICAHANRLSPTRYFYISARLFRDLPDPEGARREIRQALLARPPELVLFDGNEMWLHATGMKQWFQDNYEATGVPRIYRRRRTAH